MAGLFAAVDVQGRQLAKILCSKRAAAKKPSQMLAKVFC